MQDTSTPAGKLVARLLETGGSVATAESCTGGLLAAAITAVPGASAVFPGGIVSYSDEAKAAVLGVPAELVRKHSAVSEPVAAAMALAVAKKFGTTRGLSTTGFAGPSGGTEADPVGTVYVGVFKDGKTEVHRYVFSGDRESVRRQAVEMALGGLATKIT